MESFQTRFGRCVVTDDELRLEHGVHKVLKRWYNRGVLYKILMGLAGLVILANILFFLFRAPIVLVWVALLAVVLVGSYHALMYGITYVRGHSRANVIPLDSITKIGCYEGGTALPLAFIVYYETDDVEKGRTFALQSTQEVAEGEFEKAKSIFGSHGIKLTKAEFSLLAQR